LSLVGFPEHVFDGGLVEAYLVGQVELDRFPYTHPKLPGAPLQQIDPLSFDEHHLQGLES